MPYFTDTGFTPGSLDEAMQILMEGVNEKFGTKYTYDTFQGTNFYKYYYGVAQRGIELENIFAEIYLKYQDYIRTTNERIAIPKTPVEGLAETFKSALGITVAVAPQSAANAGTISVCALLNDADADYPAQKQKVLQGLKDYTVAGLYYAGDQRGDITLSNGQVFDYGFYLPTYHDTELKINITPSRNTRILVDSDDTIKEKLLKNIKDLYGLGLDFAPERCFTVDRDAPYAGKVVLSYKRASDSAFRTDIFTAGFRDLMNFDKEKITVVIGNV
ncbi:hypothetical protein AAIR98_001317 [Elusimicrobium simillimum]|uniref:hypothetical protein n=1 Tax=Elusimicrobium simillimum TaxID=3143438 RepID=UPI003C702D24